MGGRGIVSAFGLAVAGSAAVGWWFARESPAHQGPIVLISVDGMPATALPVYGAPRTDTPAIDLLAVRRRRLRARLRALAADTACPRVDPLRPAAAAARRAGRRRIRAQGRRPDAGGDAAQSRLRDRRGCLVLPPASGDRRGAGVPVLRRGAARDRRRRRGTGPRPQRVGHARRRGNLDPHAGRPALFPASSRSTSAMPTARSRG